MARFVRKQRDMDHEDTLAAISCLLDPPNPRVRAQALLRDLLSLQAAAQGDVGWWRARGALSVREAERLSAAFKLHALVQCQRLPPCIIGPEEVVRCLRSLAGRGQEELWILTVDSGLRPISRSRVSSGGRSSCSATPIDVLRIAVHDQAAGLFLAHNHPSGDPRPSRSDQRFTAQVKRAATALGVQLHDHVVMTTREWTSELTGVRGLLEPSALQSATLIDSA